MRAAHVTLAGLLALALLTAACSGKRIAAGAPSSADSAGVRIVHLASLDTPGVPLWQSTLVFSTLGNDSLELGAGAAFNGRPVIHAAFGVDTSLWLTNDADIIVLHSDGSFARHASRRGDGPGEYTMVFTLGVTENGSMFASDYNTARFTQLDRQGRVERIVTKLDNYAEREIEPTTVLPDGRIFAAAWQWRIARGPLPALPATPFNRDPVPLLVYDSTGKAIDTLGIWRGLERSHGLPVPFARSAVYDGRGRATLIGISDSLDLSLFEGTRLKLRLFAPAGLRHASPEDRAAWNSTVMHENADITPTVVRDLTAVPDVPALPDIGGVVVDDHQNIWVGAYVTPNQSVRIWHIFSSAGKPLGKLELPALRNALMPTGTELLDVFGGRIAVLREDEQGELFVEVRAIQHT